MDQDAFRETYREVNEVYCAFEKSILTNECGCAQAERFCIAEREGVHCQRQASQVRCIHWLQLLREHARFALRTDEERRLLPHGKAIRLQVGGMRGLAPLLDSIESTTADIDQSLGTAEHQYDQLEAVPFAVVMREVSAYQVRKRSRRRK